MVLRSTVVSGVTARCNKKIQHYIYLSPAVMEAVNVSTGAPFPVVSVEKVPCFAVACTSSWLVAASRVCVVMVTSTAV